MGLFCPGDIGFFHGGIGEVAQFQDQSPLGTVREVLLAGHGDNQLPGRQSVPFHVILIAEQSDFSLIRHLGHTENDEIFVQTREDNGVHVGGFVRLFGGVPEKWAINQSTDSFTMHCMDIFYWYLLCY